MKLIKCKLGEHIELYSEQCNLENLTVWDVSGVNSDKEFFTPSKQIGKDTKKYKIVPPNYFACNLMHVGRDKVLPIALNYSTENKIVSPAYTVFKIIDENVILKDYFFMMLKSKERDRYFWFHTDSSVRDGMSWEDFCDLNFNLPSVSTQKKFVNIYKSIILNKNIYEKNSVFIKSLIDIEIEKCKKTNNKVPIKEILREIDERNSENIFKIAHGINIDKDFMISNLTSSDLNNYKIVKKNQFVFSGMQTGRDESIRISLLKENNPIIVSPAYSVFEVKYESILPEYLMVWFLRKETDRFGWFLSDSSVRSNLDLDRFYEMKIPCPAIEEQEVIKNLYDSLLTYRKLYEKFDSISNSISSILIRGSLEEALNE